MPIFIFAMATPGVTYAKGKGNTEVHSYKVAQGDPTLLPNPFPPWDVGPLPGGFSADILNAICDANAAMDCEIEVKTYDECLFTDDSEPSKVGVGSVLLGTDIVSCLSWIRTNPRSSRGVVFTDAYSDSAAPGANDAAILSTDTSPNTGRELAFANGFAADFNCTISAGYGYTVPDPLAGGSSAAINAVDGNTDAIVLQSDIDAFGPLPAGVNVFPVESDGTTPLRCGEGITAIAYPSGDFEQTHNFIEDFNCGLKLIAANGTYDQICDNYDGGDRSLAPYCFTAEQIGEPSKSCKMNESKGKK